MDTLKDKQWLEGLHESGAGTVAAVDCWSRRLTASLAAAAG